MFDFILNILKNLTESVGKGANWIWDHMVPSSVKDKINFKEITFGGAVSFIFQQLRHWYFYMTVASVYVTYRLFVALQSSGILARFKITVESTMNDIFRIADQCLPMIGDLKKMLQCIGIH
jgi:hypothetical protein